MNFFASVVVTFLIEPHNALRAAFLMLRGLKRKNLNPKSLSPEQLKCAPVLFIHGDASNSAVFVPMIDQIAKESPHKPLFTIDLTSADGTVSAKNHLHLILAKVSEIAALYPSSKTAKISFVGHSSGGDLLGSLIRVMHEKKLAQPGTLFKIGSIFKTKIEAEEFGRCPLEKIIEIVGTKDLFEGCNSYLSNKLVVVSGHLGLLFNKDVLRFLSQKLSEN